ncbi:MAG: nuclear transport factor 2 family protein [Hyphomonadaceae bacterium]|nr:nuclear transport factor 2 family protein [Hyphomonadaceae bacterium]
MAFSEITMTIPPTIVRWHRIALERLPEELAGILADDAVFESPVVHTPQVGKAIVEKYLRGALHVLNTEHFRYGGEWFSDAGQGAGSAVLEFFSEIDGIKINGIDIIHWNDAGLITHFKVMVRPLKAINVLHAKMGAYLMKAG